MERTIASDDDTLDLARAKEAASDGPVILTEDGAPAYVLVRFEEWGRRTARKPSLVDLISQTGPEHDFEFDPPKLNIKLKIPTLDD